MEIPIEDSVDTVWRWIRSGPARGLGRGEISRASLWLLFLKLLQLAYLTIRGLPFVELRAAVALKMGSNCSILVELLQK